LRFCVDPVARTAEIIRKNGKSVEPSLSKDDHYDVVIIGAGAAGSLAAELCTARGYRTLVLDAGPELSERLPADGRQSSSQSNYFSNETSAPLIAAETRLNVEARKEPFHWIHVQGLGGRTLFWQGVALRMTDDEFKAASRHGHGIDWPISQSDLDPYYSLCEKRYCISGKMNPTKQSVVDKLHSRFGLSAYACPYTSKYFMRPNAGYRGYLEDSIADNLLEPRDANLTVQSMAVVKDLVLAPGKRRVEAARYFDRRMGRDAHVSARVFIVCASTLESTRILLASRDGSGGGLQERTHGLGHYLMSHLKGVSLTAAIYREDYLRLPEDLIYCPYQRGFHEDSTIIRGWGLQIRVKDTPENIRINTIGEDLPYFGNCVRIDAGRADDWGRPVLEIDFTWGENELRMQDAQIAQMERFREVFGGGDAAISRKLGAPGSNNHELGTARMGASPDESVLDRHNRVWGYDNLYVVDGSAFSSSGYQNPTLTILALTWRACAHICEHFQRGSTA
jgi:choline dehydrogenase-like flavoprotein